MSFEFVHIYLPDQNMEPSEDPDECTCRRRECDDCGIGPDDARDYDD